VAYGIGGTLGGVAGGYALQYLGGQHTFMLAALFPLLGFLVIALGLKLTAQQHQRGLFG
jgi:PPP family 3-phenylpropionic acid transporter